MDISVVTVCDSGPPDARCLASVKKTNAPHIVIEPGLLDPLNLALEEVETRFLRLLSPDQALVPGALEADVRALRSSYPPESPAWTTSNLDVPSEGRLLLIRRGGGQGPMETSTLACDVHKLRAIGGFQHLGLTATIAALSTLHLGLIRPEATAKVLVKE